MKKKNPPKRKANIPAFLKGKKVSAQSSAYIKGYKVQPIKEAEVFKNAGIKKLGAKYYNKQTGRPFKDKQSAKNFAAKQAGFSSYQKYLDTRKSKTYKQFEKRAREKGQDVALGKNFAKLYRDWQKGKFKKKSEELRKLLKPLGWIDKYNYSRYV
jgi:hypothetical protein